MFDTMLTLAKRDAKVARNIPFRTQNHGDDLVKATDVAFSGIMLAADEFCALLQEALAHKALYVQRAGSRLYDPLFKHAGELALLGAKKIEAAHLTLYLGVDGRELALGLCKLKGSAFTCNAGGMTEWCFTAQATPKLDKRIGELIDAMGAAVQIEIRYEHNAEQPDLALGGETPRDEDDDEEEDNNKPSRGRRGRNKNGEGRVGAR